MRWKWLVVSGLALLMAAPAMAQEPATLVKIFSEKALWGKDFPLALASLPSWNRLGERTVALFPNRILNPTPLKSRNDAQAYAARLTGALRAPLPRPRPQFAALLRDALRQQPLPLETEIIPYFLDDGSVRVALTRREAEFLAPKLTLATVHARLGSPEKVTNLVVGGDREERPVILTLHSYAGGEIVFAESDVATRPGFVDRVILDVPALTMALFEVTR